MSEPEEHAQDPPHVHGPPPEGLECLCTMEDITPDNYVEYQSHPSHLWRTALYEQSVVEQLLATQFHDYIGRVHRSDCQAELKRLLAAGPPVYLQDHNAMPLALESDTHICRLYFGSDGLERSAVLHGARQGAERMALWEELKQFIVVEGKEEGDDDDDENAEGPNGTASGSEPSS